jgi:opacity protein-like surface antigen
MKKTKILTTTALTTILAVTGLSTKLYAQSKNFSGPYMSIGATNQNNDSKVTRNGTPTAPVNGVYVSSSTLEPAFIGFNSTATTIISRLAGTLSNSDDKINGTVSIGYNNPINQNYLIGIQGSYTDKGADRTYRNSYTRSTVVSADGDDAEGDNSSFTVSSATGTQSVKLSDKESWSISLLPSYAVNNDLMLFGKVGYTTIKQVVNITYSGDSASNRSSSKDLDGYTLGLGARYNINKNLFISAGFDASKFDKYTLSQTDTATPTIAGATLNTSRQTLTTQIDNEYIYNTTISIGYTF